MTDKKEIITLELEFTKDEAKSLMQIAKLRYPTNTLRGAVRFLLRHGYMSVLSEKLNTSFLGEDDVIEEIIITEQSLWPLGVNSKIYSMLEDDTVSLFDLSMRYAEMMKKYAHVETIRTRYNKLILLVEKLERARKK